MRGLQAKGKGARPGFRAVVADQRTPTALISLQRRLVGFRHPVAHLIGVRRKFELDRGGAGKTSVPNGGKVLSERRISSPGRQVAMIEAVAIGDVDLSDPALEPSERGRGNSHQPEMRDVHCRLDVLQADVVQETLHIVQRLDEGELERKQLDRKLEAPFSRHVVRPAAWRRPRASTRSPPAPGDAGTCTRPGRSRGSWPTETRKPGRGRSSPVRCDRNGRRD